MGKAMMKQKVALSEKKGLIKPGECLVFVSGLKHLAGASREPSTLTNTGTLRDTHGARSLKHIKISY